MSIKITYFARQSHLTLVVTSQMNWDMVNWDGNSDVNWDRPFRIEAIALRIFLKWLDAQQTKTYGGKFKNWQLSCGYSAENYFKTWGEFGYEPLIFNCTLLKLNDKSPLSFLMIVGVPCIIITRGSAAQISANHVVKKKVLKKVSIFLNFFNF
jgi:hypothetical protein